MAWKIEAEKLGIRLPPGFYLEEDVGFLYLKHDGKIVAVFSSHRVDPKEIEKEAWGVLGIT